MREVFEMYKKIENYYPLFFAFLGFIGIYYFDFIVLLINNFNHWFLATTTLTTVGLVWSLYYMIRIIFTNKWTQDVRPFLVYQDLFDQVTIEEKEKNNGIEKPLNEIDLLVRKQYLTDLEEWLDKNFKNYSIKKKYVSNVLKVIVITLIMYSFNIIHFKQLNIVAKIKQDETNEGIKNNKPLLTDSTENSELRKLIRQEIDLYFKEQSENVTKGFVDKTIKLSDIKK
jgi:hypothetical protein